MIFDTQTDTFIRPSIDAYGDAMQKEVLTDIPGYANYAGDYMYMYSDNYHDYFKHKDTRKQLVVRHYLIEVRVK